MLLDPRCGKLVVGGLGDSADQDPKTDPRQHAVGLEQLSEVCQALASVTVVRVEDSARSRQPVRRSV